MYTLRLLDETGWFVINTGSVVGLVRSCNRWLAKGCYANVTRYDGKHIIGIIPNSDEKIFN